MSPQTPVAEYSPARGRDMTASKERAPRRVDPRGISPVSIGASSGVDDVVRRGAGLEEGFVDRRADDLDAQAAYYHHRAIQEERALGPGYYVDLLEGMATDRAAMARRMRLWNGTR